jgi:hypothetical protein
LANFSLVFEREKIVDGKFILKNEKSKTNFTFKLFMQKSDLKYGQNIK